MRRLTQLAEEYLTRKTKELGEILDADRRQKELQRVKMYLADNNVYGVDLNPVAVELGKISVWLNTLVPGGFVPWFGDQFKCGNSLVGAWRRVYANEPTHASRKWWEAGSQRIYHFPKDALRIRSTIFFWEMQGWCSIEDKVVKKLTGDQIKQLAAWRTAFTKPHHEGEIHQLQYFSKLIDELWNEHVRDLHQLESQTTDPFPSVYPNTERSSGNLRRSSTRSEREQFIRRLCIPKTGTRVPISD